MAEVAAKPLEDLSSLLEASLEHTVKQQLLGVSAMPSSAPSSAAKGGSCAASEDGPGLDAASRDLIGKDGKQVAWERRFVQMVLSLVLQECVVELCAIQ